MADAVHICLADYANPVHANALVAVLDAYACDPMGGGEGLSDFAKANVVAALAARPQAYSVLAFADSSQSQAVGLVNCIEGYSTFKARPLMNIHDIAVLPGHRGQGVGRALLQAAQTHAKDKGCCKLTLEVLTGNAPPL